MAELYVGTSGYAHAAWRERFYPPGLPPTRWLEFYSQRFRTVEINYTFYRTPTPGTLDDWLAATPPGFQFALIANRQITHGRRLENIEAPLARFLEVATVLALANRLGPLLFQLPPDFTRDTERLEELLRLRPRAARFAVAFAHPSWFTDEVYATLRRYETALCWRDSETPARPEVVTAAFIYLRLSQSRYTPDELAAWREKLDAGCRAGRDVYVYLPGDASAEAPASAQRLASLAG